MRKSALMLLLLIPAACGPSTADLDKLKADVVGKLAAVEAAGQAVKQTAALEGDTLEVKGPAPTFHPCLGKENAVALGAEDVEDLAGPPPRFSLVIDNPLRDLASWARKGILSDGSTPAGKALEDLIDRARRLQNLRYVLVARTRGGVESKVLDPATFEGGRWEAEALLVDVSTGSLLGGIVFSGQNDAEVKVEPDRVRAYLLDNLRKNAQAAAKAAFLARFPGATPPFHDP